MQTNTSASQNHIPNSLQAGQLDSTSTSHNNNIYYSTSITADNSTVKNPEETEAAISLAIPASRCSPSERGRPSISEVTCQLRQDRKLSVINRADKAKVVGAKSQLGKSHETEALDSIEDRVRSSFELAYGDGRANDHQEREQWSNKVEYMLSVIGYVVDLGSKTNMIRCWSRSSPNARPVL